jgi:UDP-glucuronate decarboxylase
MTQLLGFPRIVGEMMNILITGGAGFIGSNLAMTLWNEGHDVYVVDDVSTGRLKNVLPLVGKPRFWFSRFDITKNVEFQNVLSTGFNSELKYLGDVGFDQIYHLASPASPPKYQIDPIKTFRVNTEGTLKVLDFAKRVNARILYTSTSEVYGDPLQHPQTEEYRGNVSTTGPRACYDEGKRGGETICCDHYRMHGTKVLIARIFNTYGPNMDPNDGRVVSNMICQALKGENLTVYGDGNQTRSFTYVDDLVDGLIRLMNSNLFAMPVNLGNPNEWTINQLASKVLEAVRRVKPQLSVQIQEKDLPIDDPKVRKPDIDLAMKYLNWFPLVNLETGLIKTVDYFAKEI